MAGRKVASSKLRVGYFAQHQVDELELDETPLQHLAAAAAGRAAGQAPRAASPPAASAPTSRRPRSGGSRAGRRRGCALLLATLDAPHLIILDEPTNHLDIESREALVEALTEYGGAVILVSHDPHLVELVADRLWLVKDGRVAPFEDDIDAYRRLLLAERGGTPRAPARTKPKPRGPRRAPRSRRCGPRSRGARRGWRSSRRCARRSTRGSPTRCSTPRRRRGGRALQRKRAEVEDGLARAEALWIAALERLEAAGARLMSSTCWSPPS